MTPGRRLDDDGGASRAPEVVLRGGSSHHALDSDGSGRPALGSDFLDAPPRERPAVLRREARGAKPCGAERLQSRGSPRGRLHPNGRSPRLAEIEAPRTAPRVRLETRQAPSSLRQAARREPPRDGLHLDDRVNSTTETLPGCIAPHSGRQPNGGGDESRVGLARGAPSRHRLHRDRTKFLSFVRRER